MPDLLQKLKSLFKKNSNRTKNHDVEGASSLKDIGEPRNIQFEELPLDFRIRRALSLLNEDKNPIAPPSFIKRIQDLKGIEFGKQEPNFDELKKKLEEQAKPQGQPLTTMENNHLADILKYIKFIPKVIEKDNLDNLTPGWKVFADKLSAYVGITSNVTERIQKAKEFRLGGHESNKDIADDVKKQLKNDKLLKFFLRNEPLFILKTIEEIRAVQQKKDDPRFKIAQLNGIQLKPSLNDMLKETKKNLNSFNRTVPAIITEVWKNDRSSHKAISELDKLWENDLPSNVIAVISNPKKDGSFKEKRDDLAKMINSQLESQRTNGGLLKKDRKLVIQTLDALNEISSQKSNSPNIKIDELANKTKDQLKKKRRVPLSKSEYLFVKQTLAAIDKISKPSEDIFYARKKKLVSCVIEKAKLCHSQTPQNLAKELKLMLAEKEGLNKKELKVVEPILRAMRAIEAEERRANATKALPKESHNESFLNEHKAAISAAVLLTISPILLKKASPQTFDMIKKNVDVALEVLKEQGNTLLHAIGETKGGKIIGHAGQAFGHGVVNFVHKVEDTRCVKLLGKGVEKTWDKSAEALHSVGNGVQHFWSGVKATLFHPAKLDNLANGTLKAAEAVTDVVEKEVIPSPSPLQMR